MKMLSRRFALTAIIMAMLVFFTLGIFTSKVNVKADNTAKTVDEVAFSMEDGAELRVVENNDSNGLRFVASMSESDYNALLANQDYTTVYFGMVIAPSDYLTTGKEFTEENLFGDSAIYAWDTWDGAQWVEYQGDLTRIINVMGDPIVEDGTATFKGAISNINEFNILREFTAKAYVVGILADGSLDVALANYYNGEIANNARSVFEIAEKAVEAGHPASDWLKSAYTENSEVVSDLSSVVTLNFNNYAENGNKADASELGAIISIEKADGQAVDFTQENGVVAIDVADLSAGEQVVSVYSIVDGAYKLFKVSVNVEKATLISNPSELLAIRNATSGHYVLTTDINMSGVTINTAATTNFGGVLDGNGHTVSNITLTSNASGFFKKLAGTNDAPATIKNIAFKDVTTSSSVQGGGLALEIGTSVVIDNLYLSASIKSNGSGALCKNCWSTTSPTARIAVTNSLIYVTSSIADWSATGYNGAMGFAFDSGSGETSKVNVNTTGTKVITDKFSHAWGSQSGGNITLRADVATSLETLLADIGANKTTFAYNNLAYAIMGVKTVSNLNDIQAMRDATTGYFVLTTDIDLGGYVFPANTTVTDASMVINGNGFAIKNFDIAKDGLYKKFNGTIKNIALANVGLLDQAGIITYEASSTTKIDNVYVSVSNIKAEGTGVLYRNSWGNTPLPITNSVIYVKSVTPTTTYTYTYADGTTNTGMKVSMLAYDGGADIDCSTTKFVTDVANLLPIAITANGTGSAIRQQFLKDNPVLSVANFTAGVADGTITVKDVSLLSKII